MTIARDIRTGAVVGQLIEPPYISRADQKTTTHVVLLTRGGKYDLVRRSSVRLEELP